MYQCCFTPYIIQFSKNHHTTNRVIPCLVTSGNSIIWTYNINEHYTLKHQNVDVPTGYNISDEEKLLSKN